VNLCHDLKMSWKNKLYFGDNLPILREYIADESVDLVYLRAPYAVSVRAIVNHEFEEFVHSNIRAGSFLRDGNGASQRDSTRARKARQGKWISRVLIRRAGVCQKTTSRL
jgi:hypothetical protein